MSNYNHVTLVGNLVRDPEVKVIGKKNKADFVLAVSRNFKAKKGEEQKAVDFFNVGCWGKLADLCGSYLAKGKKVLVDGRLQVRTYQEKDTDERKWFTEVVAENLKFLSPVTQN